MIRYFFVLSAFFILATPPAAQAKKLPKDLQVLQDAYHRLVISEEIQEDMHLNQDSFKIWGRVTKKYSLKEILSYKNAQRVMKGIKDTCSAECIEALDKSKTKITAVKSKRDLLKILAPSEKPYYCFTYKEFTTIPGDPWNVANGGKICKKRTSQLFAGIKKGMNIVTRPHILKES